MRGIYAVTLLQKEQFVGYAFNQFGQKEEDLVYCLVAHMHFVLTVLWNGETSQDVRNVHYVEFHPFLLSQVIDSFHL